MNKLEYVRAATLVTGEYFHNRTICRPCGGTRISNYDEIRAWEDANEYDHEMPNRTSSPYSKRPKAIACDEYHDCFICGVDLDNYGLLLVWGTNDQGNVTNYKACSYLFCSVTCSVEHVTGDLSGLAKDDEVRLFYRMLSERVREIPSWIRIGNRS